MWVSNARYPFDEGDLFIGANGSQSIGIKTERHAVTIAGAGAGKGAAVIMPNLLRWPHNSLTIDPKGEAAEATAKHRDDLGLTSHVLAPFGADDSLKKYLASYNLLDGLDPASMTIKEDIDTISDGIVMRPDPSADHWDTGAQVLISGLIGLVLMTYPKNLRNLIEVRKILRDDDLLHQAADAMKTMDGCGGVCKAAASAITAKEGGYFVSNAQKNTTWLDSEAMKNVLQTSSFDLADLKRGKASVYLVLPANYIAQHGRFLRLFVRCAINEMARPMPDGSLRGSQCLFLLDEFFSLGYIDEIAKAAGLMRGYGLQMWVILQDLGQLQKLYGHDGAETFFGNADLHQFFGTTDQLTNEYISRRLGVHDVAEMPTPPTPPSDVASNFGRGLGGLAGSSKNGGTRAMGAMLGGAISMAEQASLNATQADYQDKMNRYQQAMSTQGRPRVSPEEVARLVQRKADVVADNMICFVFGSESLLVTPAPYFRVHETAPMAEALTADETDGGYDWGVVDRSVVFMVIGGVIGIASWLAGGMETEFAPVAPAAIIGFFVGWWAYVLYNYRDLVSTEKGSFRVFAFVGLTSICGGVSAANDAGDGMALGYALVWFIAISAALWLYDGVTD